MEYRTLGPSTLEIAPLVFGGNVFGWTLDEAASFRMLDDLVDRGINMLDTANVYSAWVEGNRGGESETIIGKWLHSSGKRDRVLLATKVGMQMGDGSKGLARDNIIRSAEASLKRLKTDCIDLYFAHIDDPSVPVEESLEAFQRLIGEGKVRYIASSNYSAARLGSVLDVAREKNLPGFIAHQPEYNLFDRVGYEGELEAVCRENGLGVVTYFSLASGFLSGKYRSADDLRQSRRAGLLGKYLTERGQRILAALDTVASGHQASMASVAIAWIIQRPGVTAPIASATSVEQLGDLVAALDLSLSGEDMTALEQASSQ